MIDPILLARENHKNRNYWASVSASLVALAEEQRKTNELLAQALKIAEHAIRFGDLTMLDCFTQHPRGEGDE